MDNRPKLLLRRDLRELPANSPGKFSIDVIYAKTCTGKILLFKLQYIEWFVRNSEITEMIKKK